MKRMMTEAQADFCDSCGAPVITAGFDVLGDVAASIVVDPVALSTEQQVTCVIEDRRTYRIEQRIFTTHLGINHPATADRWMNTPDDVLVEHRCGRVFPGKATKAFMGLFDIHAANYLEDIPW